MPQEESLPSEGGSLQKTSSLLSTAVKRYVLLLEIWSAFTLRAFSAPRR